MQMPGILNSLIVVLSGGGSCAMDGAPTIPRAVVDPSAARTWRRVLFILAPFSSFGLLNTKVAQLLSSRLSCSRKRQSVLSDMILLGFDLIRPASRSRSA